MTYRVNCGNGYSFESQMTGLVVVLRMPEGEVCLQGDEADEFLQDADSMDEPQLRESIAAYSTAAQPAG